MEDGASVETVENSRWIVSGASVAKSYRTASSILPTGS
jgi:hypothetical protein